jgi:hypothetical protein
LHRYLSIFQGIGGGCYSGYNQSKLFFDVNHLGKLGNINSLPNNEEIDIFVKQKFFGERIFELR